MDLYEMRSALNQGKSIYDLNLRVTFYARVSTEKEEQLHSLAAQVQYYTDYIIKCPSWTLVDGYVDEGNSGTSAGKRESFLKMVGDAKHGKFDFIVTKEISRFSRNTLDSIRYTQELLQCGVGVLFQSDNINTLMPDAELRLTIMSSIAQDEVRKISERVKFGFRRAIESGVVLGNSKIWGYEKQDGKLVIQEQEAELVRLIFDLYANRQMGIRAIAGHLTDLGYQNTRGRPFSFSTIRGILSNPKYKGYYCGGKSCKYDYKLSQRKYLEPADWVMYKDEQSVPPIVSEELWDRANQLLSARAQARRSPEHSGYQNRYPYSGKIICARHHIPYYHAVRSSKSGSRELWQCQEYARKGRSGCTSPALYTSELDDIIRQTLDALPLSKAELAMELMQIYASTDHSAKRNASIAKCKAAMDVLHRRKDRLLDLNIEGRISDQEFALRNERFNQEIEAWSAQQSALEESSCLESDVLSGDALQQAILYEMDFAHGFEAGVLFELLDRIEVSPAQSPYVACAKVMVKPVHQSQEYLVRRRSGKSSVCSIQYI